MLGDNIEFTEQQEVILPIRLTMRDKTTGEEVVRYVGPGHYLRNKNFIIGDMKTVLEQQNANYPACSSLSNNQFNNQKLAEALDWGEVDRVVMSESTTSQGHYLFTVIGVSPTGESWQQTMTVPKSTLELLSRPSNESLGALVEHFMRGLGVGMVGFVSKDDTDHFPYQVASNVKD